MLIKTKLCPPRCAHELVVRSRLLRPSAAKLRLIQAPPGYGKSTLALQLAEQPGQLMGWLSLDAHDNDPNRFWLHVFASLGAAHPVLEQALSQQEHANPLDRVMAALNSLPPEQKLSLVLDDFQHLTHPKLIEEINLLCDYLPANLTLLITSRIVPPLRVAHRKSKGLLQEIDMEALRFSNEEAERYFHSHGISAEKKQELEEVVSQSGGWIAALQLICARVTSDTRNEERAPWILPAIKQDLYGLLVDEVLAVQPENIQQFLMQIALLPRFCGALCDQVRGRDDSGKLIDEMIQRQLFIVPLDEQHGWYRIHDLFLTLLLERYTRYLPDYTMLRWRAGQWFEANHFLLDAADQYIEGEHWPDLVRVMSNSASIWDIENYQETIRRTLYRLPEHILNQHASLLVLLAWVLPSQDRLRKGAELLSRAQQLIVQARAETTREGQALLCQIYSLEAFNARLRQDWSAVLNSSQQALHYANLGAPSWRWRIYSTLGSCHYIQGQLRDAEQALENAYEQVRERKDHLKNNAYIAGYLSEVLMHRGRLNRAREVARQTRLWLESTAIMKTPYAGWRFVGEIDVLRERNELTQAKSQLHELATIRQLSATDLVEHIAIINRHFLYALSANDATLATESIDALERCIAAAGFAPTLISGSPDGMRARFALRRGDVKTAERALTSEYNVGELQFSQHPDALTRVRLLHAKRQSEAALQLLERIRAQAERQGADRTLAICAILKSLTLEAMRQPKEAEIALLWALTQTERENFIRLYLDEGEALLPILQRLKPGTQLKHYVELLVRAFIQEYGVVESDPLSPREHDIVVLVGSGLSSKEIAKRLGISPGTVKTHLRNAYRKLGVNGRVKAAAKLGSISDYSLPGNFSE